MKTLEELEPHVRRLSKADKQVLLGRLEDMLEDELEFTDTFNAKIARAKRDIASGNCRIVKP
ncbi:MAG: hypothetical protein HYY24_28865 [Verrucomicrobia bacterium]|nr:hypothetical protein [Verrucomicrobiota bacterium]